MTEFTSGPNGILPSLNRHDMTTVATSDASIYADCTVSTDHMTGIVDNIVEMPPPAVPNTAGEWVLSDTDVSNGFVKDGSSLPYVFEANESGVRKRSTKILPVCGMCGKKFVCVTTMKRHLVTHTGEKPFSCKVCGKQYTQKGNLRVHERTHRNDRPFQCNICTQKFYRKEPMQKHQWRQHGIVHLKQRPNNTTSANNNNPIGSNNNNNNNNNNSASSSLAVIGAEDMLYKSLTASVMDGSNGGISHQHVDAAEHSVGETTTLAFSTDDQTAVEQQQHHQFLMPHQYHHQEHSLAPTEYHVVETSLDDYHQANLTESGGLLDSPVAYIVQSTEDEVQYASIEVYTEETGTTDHYQEAIILNTQDVEGLSHTIVAEAETASVVDTVVEHDQASSVQKPVKLKMKLAQAYLREIEENRELESLNESLNGGRDSRHDKLECNLSSIRLSSSPEESNIDSSQQYLHVEQASLESIVAKLTLPNPAAPLHVIQPTAQQTTDHPDTLEFICKSCNSRCLVSDPYSFRCGTCNMKYTSLPTHLIAEPLQCIGCVQIFPHKPALKQHQSSGVKERPFKCCKCGFEFRQKAHLQKHQWRIHRKKYDTVDSATVKDEHQSVAGTVVDAQANTVEVETTTAQAPMPNEIVQKLVADQEASPLDLSPAKMYGTAGSINKWVQQVEVARTPIKPDVTIHKASAANDEDMTTFKDILSRPPVNQLKDQVQLQIINPLNGGKEESLTLHLSNKQPVQTSNSQTQVPQAPIFAVKSRPTATIELQQRPRILHAARDHENNPLLNQVIESSSDQVSINIPPNTVDDPRSPKRARTDVVFLSPPPSNNRQQPADLSIHSQQSAVTAQLRTPLAVKTSPLRLETQYSTVSPPLNLSSSTTTSPQVSPYDYRVTKSALSGHFQRLKSQDGRHGI